MADKNGRPKSRESITAHQPILPAKAIELVKSRNLDGADALLADFAAAGLIKTYALMREVKPAGRPAKMVRDAQIPAEDWERNVSSNKVDVALSGTTVRLEGSPLQGGTPSVRITGISFSETSLLTVLDRYCAKSPDRVAKQPNICQAATKIESATPSTNLSKSEERYEDLIKPGALTVSVAQAMQATGLGRTSIDKLMRNGTLVRTKVGRRTLISVESIERLVGAKVAG